MPNILINATDLTPILTANYSLPPTVECELIRRGFNDHYKVFTPTERYILRLYFQNKYYIESDSDFRFELDLLDFLHANGAPVSHPIRRKDGGMLGEMETSGGLRYYSLFTYAEGEIGKKLDPSRARALGQSVARLHQTADLFQTTHHRYHLNLRYLLDEPIQLMQTFLQERNEEGIEAFLPAVQDLRTQIQALPTSRPAYGIIHGDMHGGNSAVTERGDFTFFDFDHGGYGWRAYDLATCKGRLTEDAWRACLEGYQQIRPLSVAEIDSVPIFQKLRPIWDKGDMLAMRAAWGDSEELGATFAKKIHSTFAELFGDDA